MVRESSPVTGERTPAGERAGAPAPTPDAGNGDRARPRRHHWLRRTILIVLVLLLLAAVAIQLVLWSGLPKRLVLNQLQSQLGLRVQAASLATGWLGNTTLRDLTLALPMAEESFLDMPRMRVKHTTLFGLMLRRPVSVDLIELQNPTLYVRRNRAGRWNVSEVAELVARAAGKKPADESAQQARPKLPEVVLSDGTVVVQDYNGPETKVRPLQVHGRPDPRTPGILWRYDVSVPDHLSVVGQVAPGGAWAHEVEVKLGNLDPWVRPWVKGFPDDASLAARWRGEVRQDGRVEGRLELEKATAAGAGAKGVVLVSNGGGTLALRPDGLVVNTPNKAIGDVKLASGVVTSDGSSVRAERLHVAAAGGQVRVDAAYTLATHSGQLDAEWTDVATGVVKHSGTAALKLSAPFPDRPQVEAKLVSRGVSPDGPWDAEFVVNGAGTRGWADVGYAVQAPRLHWRGNYPVDLSGMTAKLETLDDANTRERVIRLTELRSPGNRVASVAEYNLTTSHWKFWISLNALPVPGEGAGGADVGVAVRKENAATQPSPGGQDPQARQNAVSLAVVLNAWGDPDKLEVGQFLVKGAEFELNAGGNYVYARPSPLDVNVKVRHIPPRIVERDRPPLYGYVSGEAKVTGTLFAPRDLRIDGKLLGEGVTAYRHSLGDLNVKIAGHVYNDKAVLKSEQFQVLKSNWSFDAAYTHQDKALTANVRVADLDLAEVGDLLVKFDPNATTPRRKEENTNLLAGRLTGEWTLVCPGADKDRLRLDGRLSARGVRAPGFVADSIDAKTVLDNGVATLGPIHLTRAVTRTVDGKDIRLEGSADAAFSADLDDVNQITASLSLKNWPLEAGESGWIDISGGTEKLVVDLASDPDKRQKLLPGKSAVGAMDFNSSLTYNGVTLGSAILRADLLGRMIDLRTIRIKTLNGAVEGQGVIELEKPLEARAFFTWDKVDALRLVDIFPGLRGLEGVFSGSMRVQPSRDPRALGPLAVDVILDADGGRYNSVRLGRTRLAAYADADRFVLNDPADLASNIEIAGGLMTLWGRVSYHDLESTKNAVSTQVLVNFRGLDLNQIIHAGHPTAALTPGRLDGELTVMGATRGPRLHPRPPGVPPPSFTEKFTTAVIARGRIRLTQAKLGALPLFSFIYDLMSLGQDVKNNNGVGDAEVRLENGSLELSNLHYFNRGTEVRALLTMDRIWNLPDSPLHGTAIGSARPLASVQLPFISEFDRLIGLLTADLASVGVEGTVRDQRVFQIGLREMGSSLRAMLFGQGPATSPGRER